MGVTAEGLEQGSHLLMNHGVAHHMGTVLVILLLIRQFAHHQQMTDLQVVGMLGQLGNRVTTVEQDPLVTIYVGDFRLA